MLNTLIGKRGMMVTGIIKQHRTQRPHGNIGWVITRGSAAGDEPRRHSCVPGFGGKDPGHPSMVGLNRAARIEEWLIPPRQWGPILQDTKPVEVCICRRSP